MTKKYPSDDYSQFNGPDFSEASLSSDKIIHQQVADALDAPEFESLHIKVERGFVFLSGHVNSKKDIPQAELRLKNIQGVRRIVNDVSVLKNQRSPTSVSMADLGIGEKSEF